MFKFIFLLSQAFLLTCLYSVARAESSLELRDILNTGFAINNNIKIQNYSSKVLDLKLAEFYSNRDFKPKWFKEGELSEQARTLRSAIIFSYQDGLNPRDYFLDQIDQLWDSPNKIDLELFLTFASLSLAADARFGRYDIRRIDTHNFRGLSLEAANLDSILTELQTAQDIDSFIQEQFPQHGQYQKMKQALAEYRQASSHPWPVIVAGAPLKLGQSGSRVLELANRLKISGDLESDASDLFDSKLLEAVIRFQFRHGLPQTGEVHAKTYAALNHSIQDRIETVLINLERWRFLSRDFSPGKEIFVNIAGYELFALEAGELKLRLTVIVGKPFQKTPVFSDQIEYIEFNPYWNIPVSIVATEIIPKLKKNPDYLASEHIKVYPSSGVQSGELSLNLSSLTSSEVRKYLFRQEHGDWNVLGKLKFVFPNIFNVYLHDTSSRDLFNRNTRAFSHGCIRVENPQQLAVFLLNTEEDPWDLERVNQLISIGQNKNVRLFKSVPVHLTYMTAWVEKDGQLNFREDIYSRDAAIVRVWDRFEKHNMPSPD